jgi:excisionase family DNA binding protein
MVSVVVPDELAGPLRTLAVAGAEALMRRDGDLPLQRGLVCLLGDLGIAARGRACDPIGAGNDDGLSLSNSPRSAAVTVREASHLMTIGCRQVRRLAAAGAVIASKTGRDWCVDRQAAEDYGKAHERV